MFDRCKWDIYPCELCKAISVWSSTHITKVEFCLLPPFLCLWMCWLVLVSCPIQYIPRNMHTVFALMCFVVVKHWLIFPYPSGLLHWHCGNLTISPVPAKQPWWIWINTSCEFIMNDCITTTKQNTTKPCAYFLGYTVYAPWEIPTNFLYCLYSLRVGQYNSTTPRWVKAMIRALLSGLWL